MAEAVLVSVDSEPCADSTQEEREHSLINWLLSIKH